MNLFSIVGIRRLKRCTAAKPWLGLIAIVLAVFPIHGFGQGFVRFTPLDLPDEVLGQDLWQYSYELNGFTFQQGQGFSLYFDHQLYANLHGLLPSGSSQWDVLAIQPDVFLAQPGLFDAQALVNAPSISVPFQVRFIWLGGSAVPGAQLFEQYDSNFQVISTGTSVVPEPGSLALVLLGLLAWCGCRQMQANRAQP